MTSPIFQGMPGRGSLVSQVRRAIGGDPQGLFQRMYESNPQFRDFANSVRGKTPEQAFKEHGLDFGEAMRRFGVK